MNDGVLGTWTHGGNESLILARTVDFERRGYFIIIFAFVNISGGCPSLVVKGGGS